MSLLHKGRITNGDGSKLFGMPLLDEIIATDSAKATIDVAQKARFKASSMFGLKDADRNKYMTCENDEWLINDSVKSMVSFIAANPLAVYSGSLRKNSASPVLW